MTQSRPRRGLPRFLKVIFLLAALMLLIVALIPTVLSTGYVQDRVRSAATDALGTPVRFDDFSLGWFSGFSLDGLSIDNPPGYPTEHQAVKLASARGSLSLLALVRGRVDFEGTVQGLDLRVFQKADGSTNLQALGNGGEVQVDPTSEPDRQPGDEHGSTSLDRLRLDLKLVDGRIELAHETEGVVEQLERIHATVAKEFDSSDVRLDFDAELARPGGAEPGKLNIKVDADAALERPLEVRYDLVRVDLARYRPLLNAFLGADQLTEFQGVVGGNGQALVDMQKQQVTLTGQLQVDGPRFAGAMLQGMDVQAERWQIQPNLEITAAEGGGAPAIAANDLLVDLGFLRIAGFSAAEAQALNGGRPSLGLELSADLGAITAFGGPIPELLRSPGTLTGRTALAIEDATFDPEQLAARFYELLTIDLKLGLDGITVEGHRISDVTGALQLQGGTAKLVATARMGGGPLSLDVAFDPRQADTWPATLALSWREAKVQAESVKALRYAVPLLAGLDAGDAELDFEGGVDFGIELAGPLMAGEAPVLEWLNHWTGTGDLALHNGAFTPAGVLQPLLQLAGTSGKLAFDDLSTAFQLKDGFIETGLLDLDQKATKIGISGRTSLAGEIDYGIDLADVLAQHRDGQRILDLLGGKLPKAKLTGTLDAPALAMPDFAGELLQGAAQKAGEDLLKKGLEKVVPKKVEEQLPDAIKKGLGELFKRKK